MKLRSRGLGRKELVLDFREYEIERVGDEVVISGTIHDPVNWEFTIRVEPQDIPGMLRVGVNPHTLRLALGWLRHPRHARTREGDHAARADGAEPAAGATQPRRIRRERSTVIDAATGTAG